MLKTCKKCQSEKTESDYYKRSDGTLQIVCKKCIIEGNAERKRLNRPKLVQENLESEEWKWVKEFEGYYQVSNKGRIKSVERWTINKNGFKSFRRERIRKIKITRYGYCELNLYKEGKSTSIRIHRVEIEAFMGYNFKEPISNHKNSVRSDNDLKNLESCTSQYNNEYKYKVGGYTFPKGEKNKLSKPIIVVYPDGSKEHITGILETSRRLGFPKTCIRRVLCNERESYKGHTFIYDEQQKAA